MKPIAFFTRFKVLKSFSALLLAMLAQTIAAQAFASKPVSMVVAYPPGGSSDFIARLLVKDMAVNANQVMTVDNVVGVAGALGTSKVIGAPADGHTLLLSSPLELILTPLAISAAKYTPEDLKLVALLGSTQVMLVTRKDLPVANFEEFLALSKKASDKPLSYCSPGLGSLYHLMGEKMAQINGASPLHVPYNGIPPCLTALMGNQVDYAFMPIAASFPGFVDNGSLKALIVTANAPNPRLPKVPLAKQYKGFEEFVFSVWAGVSVGGKVPEALSAQINKAVYTTLGKPEVRKTLEATGAVLSEPMSTADLAVFYTKEIARYQAIAKSINLAQQ